MPSDHDLFNGGSSQDKGIAWRLGRQLGELNKLSDSLFLLWMKKETDPLG